MRCHVSRLFCTNDLGTRLNLIIDIEWMGFDYIIGTKKVGN